MLFRSNRLHIKPRAPLPQSRPGIGGHRPRDNIGPGNLHIFRIIGAQNLQRRKALIGQCHRAPLGHPLAGGGGAVAEGREIRRNLSRSAHIFIKNLIHNPADGFIDSPAIHEILVISRAAGDVEIISAAPVPWSR